MRKYGYLLAATGAVLLATLGAVPAAADPVGTQTVNVLTYGSEGGSNVDVGDTLSASLKTGTAATFYSTTSGSTGVTCTSSTFRADVDGNPAAPGTATETVTEHTFASCTENVSGVISVQSVTVDNLNYAATVDSATATVTVTGTAAKPIQTTVVLNTLLGRITCVYLANGNTVTGATSDADNSIMFDDEPFTKSSGPSVCFSNAYFTATYAPVVDEDKGNSPVFVN